MAESRVLSNIPYTIHNRSNYDIVTEETRDIVDVPYFPAQNLVDVTGELNVYKPPAEMYFAFEDEFSNERVFALIHRTDSRYLFVEFADDARYLHYSFAGNSFPQGREDTTYTYDGSKLYLYAGYSNGRCTNDLWEYDPNKVAWTNINYTNEEQSANEVPSRRRKASILKTLDKIWLFGGETDILTINSLQSSNFVVLNDLWSFDLNTRTWTNYDKNRVLPHRAGHVVHIDSSVVKIYIEGGMNEIGVYEPSAIWEVSLVDDSVTYTAYSGPFTCSHNNICMQIDGVVHILVGTDLYKWDNTNSQFVLVKSNVSAINPHSKNYWQITTVSKDYGQQSTMGSMEINNANLYDWNDTLISTKTIELPPRGQQIPRINIDNVQTFFYGGLIDGAHFNESTYVMNHTTRQVYKYDFPEDQKPTERAFPALAYDRYRGRVWLFGGFDGTKFYNDLWYFDLGTHTWTKVHDQLENTDEENPDYPQPRQKAGMCIVADNYLYIISGYSDVHAFSDFWVYDITKGEWSRVYTADDIPWGSQYYIFEWRDRLFLYNGQQLYRYFKRLKQFVAQPFLIGEKCTDGNDSSKHGIDPDNPNEDPIALLIVQKKYLETPITVTVVNDKLFVQNDQYLFSVDLESRILTNITDQFDVKNRIIWLDNYYGLNINTLSDIYINVSPLYPLTKNQIPHSFWAKETMAEPELDAVMFQDYSSMSSATRLVYQDNAGLFKVQRETEAIDKARLLVDGDVSVAGTANELSDVNFDDPNDVWDKTIEALTKPYTYPYRPWYLFNSYKPVGYAYTGAQRVVYNDKDRRIYIIYKNGNTLRLNPVDNTFFTYFTKLWRGSAIGYYQAQNKIYAFGGIRNERRVYMQNGLECTPITIQTQQGGTKEEITHCGLLEFNLSINEMNVGSIEAYQREHNISMVDYSITKEYLLSLVSHYIDGYANNTIPATLDQVKEKIYTATQPIIDDLSQFDFTFEQGQRPTARAYTANCQIGSKLYVFGGCECYKQTCPQKEYNNMPYGVNKPGTLANEKAGSNLYNPDEEAKKAYVFNMDLRSWEQLPDLPTWLYMASAIPSPDGRYIYIVGGFTSEDCSGLSNKIYRYDTANKIYEEIRGVPDKFAPRANALLYWMDEYHLLIQYGIRTKVKVEMEDDCTTITYFHIPVNDAWILDTRSHIMYKAFEDLMTYGGIIAKDTFFVNESPEENSLYILSPSPVLDNNGDPMVRIYKWNLVNGAIDVIPVIPTSTIRQDYNAFEIPTFDSKIDKMTDPNQDFSKSFDINSTTLWDVEALVFQDSNFRFRYAWIEQYGAYNHKHMFIIGERGEESGIDYMEEIARGHKEAHLRFWMVDLELPDQNRFLQNIVYEYPLPVAPVALAYDGRQYIYCIYNKYNIWRLNFKKVLEDPNGSWWYRLPPCIDCNFLGDDRTDPSWDSFFIPPRYLCLFSIDGKMARMDTETFTWFADKLEAPEPPVGTESLISASGVDQNEVYLYNLGGISGKVMNVYEKQWDNFFFDMRTTSKVAQAFSAIIPKKLWPTVVRRRRLYTQNHVGHLFYSWLRIDGEYDVEFQMQDFYQGDEIRIYGDYDYLQNWDNTYVSVFTIGSGWVDLDQSHYTPTINEVDWDWDGAYTRRYIRQFVDASGHVVTQYSKLPPNYLSIDLNAALGGDIPISKIRVKYKNKKRPYNYLTHINRVELITTQTILAGYDSPSSASPLIIVHIQPMTVDENYSNEFGITVKNTGSKPVKDVTTYAWDNDWIQFSLNPADPNSWTIRDQDNPFLITSELSAGGQITFYIRAVNIDLRPHIKDLVIKGIYAYEG